MGLEFIDRSLRTSGVVLLIFLPFGIYYLGVYPALAVFSGGIWGMLNLIFISALVRATIRPGGADRGKALAVGLFKFPLLYLAGYFLLKIPQMEPLLLLIGFSSLFVVIVLKALGKLLTQAHDGSSSGEKVKGIA